ncbi:MAG: hypothetical protein LUD81_08740 [Clostridiales bacterium]|nr:hypothetical protein [Clostridiales bacterium]
MNSTYEYIKSDGTKGTYTLKDKITLEEKALFVTGVAGVVVSKDLGYVSLLDDVVFNYALIRYFTDIKIPEGQNLSQTEEFCENNKEVIDRIVKTIGDETYSSLVDSCYKAIEYRKTAAYPLLEKINDVLEEMAEISASSDILSALTSELS